MHGPRITFGYYPMPKSEAIQPELEPDKFKLGLVSGLGAEFPDLCEELTFVLFATLTLL
jgi:hypothetical protein